MTRTNEQELSGVYQHNVGQLVGREVIYCVSGLISDLMKMDVETNEHSDDLLALCVQDDWTNAAFEHGAKIEDAENGWIVLDQEDDSDMYENFYDNEEEAAQSYCEYHGLDPQQHEAYEHWIVSTWLADRLAEKGEMTCKDIHGLTIWGRTTTGQGILLDRVICDIYDELHA